MMSILEASYDLRITCFVNTLTWEGWLIFFFSPHFVFRIPNQLYLE